MNMEKNAGDMTSRYPDAAEIPAVKMDSMQKPGANNPVVDAFETIMKYVQSLEQRNAPNAAAAKQHITGLLQTIVGGTQPGGEQPETPPKPGMPPIPQADSEEPPKLGYDPFKDPSDEEDAEAMSAGDEDDKEMLAKKRKNRPKNIEPLA